MNKKNITAFLAGMFVTALLTVGANAEPTKVGFVYVGPTNDGGWTQAHDKGRLALEEAFGDKESLLSSSSVNETVLSVVARDEATTAVAPEVFPIIC